MEKNRTYIAIDLKSFYASVECVERGLDPLTTNLVVADITRTEKTICLAVTPSLKAYGLSGRSRLFEVVQKVKEINRERLKKSPNHKFISSSFNAKELSSYDISLDYIVAPPRMATYMQTSGRIYSIYLRFVSPEDIHVYSVDEVFIDATDYLKIYHQTAREFAETLVSTVFKETGITATAGIAPNLFLCKVAMDIEAKHCEPDENGVRIAELDVMSYRRKYWDHQPITDFWRVGKGYEKRLKSAGIYTMRDIAHCSVRESGEYSEETLYDLFGVNAELLIDHAWGYEPCTIADIKAYKPTTNSVSTGQVLSEPYPFEKAKLIAWEMIDLLSMDLVKKRLVTNQIVINIGYDTVSIKNGYTGERKVDRYGREVPKDAHGTINLKRLTSSTKLLTDASMELFDRIVDRELFVRRLNITACKVVPVGTEEKKTDEQLDLFTDYEARAKAEEEEDAFLEREQKRQRAVLEIREKYGKNAILKGRNFEEGATTIERNGQVGGHKA